MTSSMVAPSASASLKTTNKSWVWQYFTKKATKGECSCKICNETVWYTLSYSTNMLAHHIQRRHRSTFADHLSEKACGIITKEDAMNPCKRSHLNTSDPSCSFSSAAKSGRLLSWLVDCPSFEKCFIEIMAATCQSYCIAKKPTFRDLCISLNKKAPVLSRAKL